MVATMGEGLKKLKVRMEPRSVRLRRERPKTVHDVGECVEVQTAGADIQVTIYAEDAVSGAPVDGAVHLGPETAQTNRPFVHQFFVEFDEKSQTWGQEPAWVEAAGYGPADVSYDLEVEGDEGRACR